MYKKQNKHTGMKSLKFLSQELCRYRWYSVILPFLACISQVAQAVLLMLLPKAVLDGITEGIACDSIADESEVS